MKTFRQAQEKANEINANLLCTQFSGHSMVVVRHEDGSQMFFISAFARKWHEWYLVFTEHQGTHVYHHEDATVQEYVEHEVSKLTKAEEKFFKDDMALYREDETKWWKQRKK